MSERFFVETPIEAEHAELVDSEAHHLAKVMRAKPGDVVTLFDGSGAEFESEITSVDRSTVVLKILSRIEIDRELPFELTLGVALPRGDRQRWLIEKAVELGVTRVVPLVTERGVAQPRDKAVLRLKRTVIEASKQCRRNRLLEIDRPQELADYVSMMNEDTVRIIAHPQGQQCSSTGGIQKEVSLALAIGPEGGFTTREIELAELAGWQTVDLGLRILRVETAAITIVSWYVLATE